MKNYISQSDASRISRYVEEGIDARDIAQAMEIQLPVVEHHIASIEALAKGEDFAPLPTGVADAGGTALSEEEMAEIRAAAQEQVAAELTDDVKAQMRAELEAEIRAEFEAKAAQE